jgi:hypothetical protein
MPLLTTNVIAMANLPPLISISRIALGCSLSALINVGTKVTMLTGGAFMQYNTKQKWHGWKQIHRVLLPMPHSCQAVTPA